MMYGSLIFMRHNVFVSRLAFRPCQDKTFFFSDDQHVSCILIVLKIIFHDSYYERKSSTLFSSNLPVSSCKSVLMSVNQC